MKHAKDVVARGRVLGNGNGPLLCVPVVGRNRAEILADVTAAADARPDLIEWRADYFETVGETNEVLDLLAGIRASAGDIPLVFTLRSEREGGAPAGMNGERIADLCVVVCRSGLVDFVDFEISAPAAQTDAVLAAARDSDTQVVLSYHNFDETPALDALLAKFASAASLGGDIAKVAVMPRDLDDVLVLLRATLQASRETSLPLVSISMGELGVFTRAVGWFFGSAITFAAGRESSAPGQLPVDELRRLVDLLGRYQAL